MQRPAGNQVGRRDESIQKFTSSLKELRVPAVLVKSEAETVEALRELVSSKKGGSFIAAGIPQRYAGAVRAALSGEKAVFLDDLKGRKPSEIVDALSHADVGITWAAYGVANEGALVEVVYDDSVKLASSLPIVSIVLVEASSVFPQLAEAMIEVGRVIAESPKERKPVVSFISGPSKTGDIEMRVLYGVHGPHSVHAVILDWPEPRSR